MKGVDAGPVGAPAAAAGVMTIVETPSVASATGGSLSLVCLEPNMRLKRFDFLSLSRTWALESFFVNSGMAVGERLKVISFRSAVW